MGNPRDTLSRLLVCSILLLLLSSVNAAESPGAGGRIVDGINAPDSMFPTVGKLGDSSDHYCTGTLISPIHVLSAGHCVSDDNGRLNIGKTEGRFTLGGQTYSTVDIIVHPTYNGSDAEGVLDLAILVLDRPVVGVTPAPIYRQAPVVGQLLTIAGYGVTGTGSTGVSDNSPTPADGTIDYGTTRLDIVTSTFLMWNFDDQPAPDKESNTAPGDSGGPAFITVNGQLQLAGVTSGGTVDNAGFGDVSYDTRVDIAAAWIDSITGTSSTTTPTVSVAATVATGFEIGPVSAVFTLSRSGDTSASLSVNLTLGGTATAGSDYETIASSVTIPAGASSVPISITPLSDGIAEGAESVTLTLLKPAAYDLGQASATVNILETELLLIVSGPFFSPSTVSTQEPVTFTAAASLSIATLKWNFGDGSSPGTGSSVVHTFTSPGNFTVTVTAFDSSGVAGDSASVSVQVNGFNSGGVEAEVSRSRFMLNFSRKDSSRIDFEIVSDDFFYYDKFEFLDDVDGELIEVYIGNTRVDEMEFFGPRAYGWGSLRWNIRKGAISYRLRSSELPEILNQYGAKNGDTVRSVTVPIFVKFYNTTYGGRYTYQYKARAGRSGIGK